MNEDRCNATRTFGSKADPYSTECYLDRRHDGDHQGWNPVDPDAADLIWAKSHRSPVRNMDDPREVTRRQFARSFEGNAR